MLQHKYRFSASALAKFKKYLDSDKEFEDFFNVDADGNYKLSLDEITADNEEELLDYINKAPQEPSEAADKGTCFNEILDRLILHQKYGRDDVEIKSGKMLIGDMDEVPVVCAKMDGFTFTFDLEICLDLAKELKGAIPQYHTEAILPTKYGNVLLHGYIDYVVGDMVVDLKTTKSYKFPKYDVGFQHDLYPYCLIESGIMDEVSEFDYLIVQWKDLVGKPTTGTVFIEPYSYDHKRAAARLRSTCEWFIEWLELNRDKITNKAIFGEE